jgi:uncharacterized repeat protein (TIGR01451 family)
VTWTANSFAPGAFVNQWVRVRIPNTVALGTNLTSTGLIEPTAGDAQPADNFDSETQVVRGSFDPNDISVTPSGNIRVTDTLEYFIRFQNTGTDTAFNISVTDTLDTDLDFSTFSPGASSHAYTYNFVSSALVFNFANINLLDSNANEPASHGFVKFRIRPKSNLNPGTVIVNRAAIYFDFNPPVITNTVTNTIASPTTFTVYPGDANNDLVCDARDVLPIGRFFNTTGAARAGASTNWTPQSVTMAWSPTDACYADCDGNGRVEAADVSAIISNWGRTHAAPEAPRVNPAVICESLLGEIDSHTPLSPAMKEIRNTVISYMKKQLGISFDFALQQNWPNPFNPSTTIRFTVPDEIRSATFTVYNLLGQVVWEREMTDVQPGNHEVVWAAETHSGMRAASGIYLYKLTAGSYSSIKRMVLIK